MKIGLVIIATGKYREFIGPLRESAEKHFLAGSNHCVETVVFSDGPPDGGIPYLAVEHRPWPYATLMRFHLFGQHAESLAHYDYLYYCDADMRFVSDVGEEVLGSLVGTIHPHFFGQQVSQFHYEANPSSTAYIPKGEGSHYFIGAFFGGESQQFLRMADTLKERVQRDLERGYIAKWHDESHLNWYFAHTPPAKRLDPSFCYPEGAELPFYPKILALKKNNTAMRFGSAHKKIEDPSRPKEFVRQDYWDKINRDYALQRAASHDGVRTWMENWLRRRPKQQTANCLEVGCYPGRYMPMMSEAGYRVNGVDLTPEVTTVLPRWLAEQGCSVGSLQHADFRLHDFIETYDLVYSVGFLEHFEDWVFVLRKHASLVAPGGQLMLSVPNFRGALQRWPRWFLDKENFYRHNLRAMRIREWVKVLRESNMKVEWCGHFGSYDFWVDRKSRTRIQTLLLQFIARHKKSIAAKVGNHPSWSPFCGIVARK